jgi:hypothetical protein
MHLAYGYALPSRLQEKFEEAVPEYNSAEELLDFMCSYPACTAAISRQFPPCHHMMHVCTHLITTVIVPDLQEKSEEAVPWYNSAGTTLHDSCAFFSCMQSLPPPRIPTPPCNALIFLIMCCHCAVIVPAGEV